MTNNFSGQPIRYPHYEMIVSKCVTSEQFAQLLFKKPTEALQNIHDEIPLTPEECDTIILLIQQQIIDDVPDFASRLYHRLTGYTIDDV